MNHRESLNSLFSQVSESTLSPYTLDSRSRMEMLVWESQKKITFLSSCRQSMRDKIHINVAISRCCDNFKFSKCELFRFTSCVYCTISTQELDVLCPSFKYLFFLRFNTFAQFFNFLLRQNISSIWATHHTLGARARFLLFVCSLVTIPSSIESTKRLRRRELLREKRRENNMSDWSWWAWVRGKTYRNM